MHFWDSPGFPLHVLLNIHPAQNPWSVFPAFGRAHVAIIQSPGENIVAIIGGAEDHLMRFPDRKPERSIPFHVHAAAPSLPYKGSPIREKGAQ